MKPVKEIFSSDFSSSSKWNHQVSAVRTEPKPRTKKRV